MKQARYAAENLGHFGLASSCYCHFTSPIRRYPDLVVHRILKAALLAPSLTLPLLGRELTSSPKRGEVGRGERAAKQLAIATSNLGEIAEHTSKRERVAMEAERDVVELKKVQFMQRHLGEEFNGYIAGVTAFGFFVELEELFVEGLVHISTLDDDMYNFDEKRHSLIGRRHAKIFRIGDAVRVKVAAVVPATRRIEFVLAGHTSTARSPGSSLTCVSQEEYPRIPIRGKRLPAIAQKAGETESAATGKSVRRLKQRGGGKRR
jgi:ribonuclease R